MATWLGAGLLLAAVLASAIGLLQYFGAAPGLDPWVHTAKPGQAMGNLRQRNQQATLLSMGLWALLWVVAQTEAHLRASSAGGELGAGRGRLAWGGRPWPLWLVGILTAWALALLAVGSAATASRTGLAQLLVILVLLALWRASVGRVALGLVLAGLAISCGCSLVVAQFAAAMDRFSCRRFVRPLWRRTRLHQPQGANGPTCCT